MANAKGTAFLAFQSLVIKKIGAAADEKIKSQLSADDQKLLFGKPILPIGWVDYGAYTRYMLLADKLFGKGDKQMILDYNSEIARMDTKGIYRIFFLVLTPKAIFGKAAQLWARYYDSGKLSMESIAGSHCELRVVDMPDIPVHHEFANFGYMAEVLRLVGAKNVRTIHPNCMARGDKFCRFDYYWDA
ncbi:MAG: hypothetical protein HGA76_02580 [Candidatus Firestonebacteria bacterium]|nr:hypothetical protein [Candidatus Firestonebacteria bacterium]